MKRGEHQLHQLLGLNELQLGEEAHARKNFELAAEYANEPKDQLRYNAKLRLLAGAQSE